MLKTHVAKETVVRMPNQIGVLDGMAKHVAEAGINLLAVTAWVEDGDAVFRLLTDEDVRTADLMREMGHRVRQTDVLVTEMPHTPGMLHRVAQTLAQGGVDITHLYATATGDQDRCLVVLGTSDNDHAMVVLNKAGL